EPWHHFLAKEAHGTDDPIMGDAAAVERPHEIRDPESLVLLADLVGDRLGVAADRRLLERLLVAEREQVFADALVELVLRGRDADGIGDQVGLRAENHRIGSRRSSRACLEESATWMILFMAMSLPASVPCASCHAARYMSKFFRRMSH